MSISDLARQLLLEGYLDEAISTAARIPMARKGTVEIRPVMDIPGLPTG